MRRSVREAWVGFSRLAAAATMRVADRIVGIESLQRVVDVVFLDLLVFEIVLIDGDADARRLLAVAVIDVDDEGHGVEGLAHRGERVVHRHHGRVDAGADAAVANNSKGLTF